MLTKQFAYRIFFSLKDDAVVVHAVLHGHRDDRHWKDRLIISMGLEILNVNRAEQGGGGKGRGSAIGLLGNGFLDLDRLESVG